MQDAKCKIQNGKCRMQNAECKMRNAECKMQNAKCKKVFPNYKNYCNSQCLKFKKKRNFFKFLIIPELIKSSVSFWIFKKSENSKILVCPWPRWTQRSKFGPFGSNFAFVHFHKSRVSVLDNFDEINDHRSKVGPFNQPKVQLAFCYRS